jgi:hypothetical protein
MMKVHALLLVATAIVVAGCSTDYGAVGNPTELTGTWSGSSQSSTSSAIDNSTYSITVASAGTYTISIKEVTTYSAGTRTYTHSESGTITGDVSSDPKVLWVNKTSSTDTFSGTGTGISATYTLTGTTSTSTDTDTTMYYYHLTKGTGHSYLLAYNAAIAYPMLTRND